MRATYIIDPVGILRHMSMNDLPVGRSVDEVLRLVKAFKYSDTHKEEVCPASWKPGMPTLIPTPGNPKTQDYFEKVHAKPAPSKQ